MRFNFYLGISASSFIRGDSHAKTRIYSIFERGRTTREGRRKKFKIRPQQRAYSITIDHRGALPMIGSGDVVSAITGSRYSFTVEMFLSFAFFQRSRTADVRSWERGSAADNVPLSGRVTDG